MKALDAVAEINQIHHENCLETMGGMSDGFIDLTVTSPPYDNLRDYKGYSFDFEPISKELYRVTKDGGVVVWIVADATVDGSETGTSFRQALGFMDVGFRLHDTMIYQKFGSGLPHKDHRYGQSFEYMFVLSKGAPRHGTIAKFSITGRVLNTTRRQKNGTIKKGTYKEGGGKKSNVWQIKGETTSDHPAPFPEKLANDHIASWSNPGDLVYDPFMGSGTTGKMAYLMGRKYIGSEISAEYVALANKRIKLVTDQGLLFS